MSEVSGVGARRHFSSDEETALRHDEPTSSIVKRDGQIGVDIRGNDASWRETKEHQQTPMQNKIGGLEVGLTAFDAGEIAGVSHLSPGWAAFGTIATPIAAFGLGLHSLHHAHENADEQAAALAKDNAHVALVKVLDLPESYRAARLEGHFKHVAKSDKSPAMKIAEKLMADPKGRAVLQLHADRGMNAARDLSRSGLSRETFLKANPRAAESYANDAAFREGFDGYLHAKSCMPPADVKALDTKLDERDGWYAQSHVSYRI